MEKNILVRHKCTTTHNLDCRFLTLMHYIHYHIQLFDTNVLKVCLRVAGDSGHSDNKYKSDGKCGRVQATNGTSYYNYTSL